MGEVVGVLFGWPVTAYLVWRAWPALRSDAAWLRRQLPVLRLVDRRGRYSGKGARRGDAL